ncbi:hypothetical protein [Pediococcus inopinatus]|uniref:hypothetical protein n=1 Tax=Pediococcus inopinatus TaxID=114090 RepID=UPI001FCFE85A|nr:hypothetical protein [Pediococcus inopinatus]
MQLQVEDDKDFDILTTTVKNDVYQYGKLYYVEDVPESEYNGLAKWGPCCRTTSTQKQRP